MNEKPSPDDLVAYCGLYCGACSFKVAFDEKNRAHIDALPAKYEQHKTAEMQFCPGCRNDESQCGDCAIRECARKRNLVHCGECADFPCTRLKDHGEALANLASLGAIGVSEWVGKQERQWTCSCGAKLSWYLQRCLECGKPLSVHVHP